MTESVTSEARSVFHACMCVGGGHVGDETRAAVWKTETFRSVRVLLAVQKGTERRGFKRARTAVSRGGKGLNDKGKMSERGWHEGGSVSIPPRHCQKTFEGNDLEV